MAGGQLYTPEEDATILRLIEEWDGKPGWTTEAVKLLDRHPSSIRNRATVLRTAGRPMSDVEVWQQRREAAEREAQKATERLEAIIRAFAPIQKPAPKKRPVVHTSSPVAVHLSDFHWPRSNKAAEAIALEAVKRLRPEIVFLNGDLWDCMAISKYDADLRPENCWTLQDEAEAGADFLHLLEAAVQPFGGKIQATFGNHEERWWKYLSKRASELLGMQAAKAQLDFKAWWVPSWSRLEFMEQDASYGDLLVTHGDIVRQRAAYSAAGMAGKYHTSLVHGHTHRLGMYSERVPDIAALGRPNRTMRVYEGGCMADLQPVYAKKPNWANAMLIMRRDEATGQTAVEPVLIEGDKAVCATLGGTLAA